MECPISKTSKASSFSAKRVCVRQSSETSSKRHSKTQKLILRTFRVRIGSMSHLYTQPRVTRWSSAIRRINNTQTRIGKSSLISTKRRCTVTGVSDSSHHWLIIVSVNRKTPYRDNCFTIPFCTLNPSWYLVSGLLTTTCTVGGHDTIFITTLVVGRIP